MEFLEVVVSLLTAVVAAVALNFHWILLVHKKDEWEPSFVSVQSEAQPDTAVTVEAPASGRTLSSSSQDRSANGEESARDFRMNLLFRRQALFQLAFQVFFLGVVTYSVRFLFPWRLLALVIVALAYESLCRAGLQWSVAYYEWTRTTKTHRLLMDPYLFLAATAALGMVVVWTSVLFSATLYPWCSLRTDTLLFVVYSVPFFHILSVLVAVPCSEGWAGRNIASAVFRLGEAIGFGVAMSAVHSMFECSSGMP